MKILKALQNEDLDSIPFWYMRQAGRYLPEYLEIKGNKNFIEISRDVEIATEISLQPYKRFQMDGIIMFADILTPFYSIPVPLEFSEKQGPVLHFDVFSKEDRKKILDFNPEELVFIREIIRNLLNFIKKTNNEVTLIGFAGAPFTLLSYLVERTTSRKFDQTKEFIYIFQDIYKELMESLTDLTIKYLKYQIDSGVQIIQIFDSWGGILSREHFKKFNFIYLKKIISEIKKYIPVILFIGNNSHLIDILVDLEPSCISLDWRADNIDEIPEKIGIQGNLDPHVLLGKSSFVKEETLRVLDKFSKRKNYIFNLGHGILPRTPLHNVEIMVRTIKEYRKLNN